MALGRRIVGPRWCVLPHDPAIDDKKSDWTKYQEALFDFESGHIKTFPGEEATLYQIAPLVGRQLRHAKSLEANSYEQYCFFVLCGLRDIKGMVLEGCEYSKPDREDRGELGHMASFEWFDDMCFAPADVESLGIYIGALSVARPLSCQRSGTRSGRSTKRKGKATQK